MKRINHTIFITLLVLAAVSFCNAQGNKKALSKKEAQSKTQSLIFDSLKVNKVSVDEKSVMIRWYSTGVKPAPKAKVFYYTGTDSKKAVVSDAGGVIAIYPIKDTTWFVYYDSSSTIPAGAVRQYFAIPHDTLGIAGNSSELAIVANTGYNGSTFRKITADREKDYKAITLRWEYSQPRSLKSFTVFRSISPDGGFSKLVTLGPADTLYYDMNLEVDRIYYYYLLAEPMNAGNAKKSTTVFGVGFDPSKPLAPFIISAKADREGVHLAVDVTDVNAAGMRVFRNDRKSVELRQISPLVRNKNGESRIIYTDTTKYLSSKLTYKYAVKAESKSYIISDFSNEVMANPFNRIPPASPTGLTAFEEMGTVVLNWDKPAEADYNIAGYIITRKALEKNQTGVKNQDSEIIIAGGILPLASNYFSDTTGTPGGIYQYKVEAVDDDGNKSAEASVITIELQPDLPIAPASISAVAVEDGIMLEWSQTVYSNLSLYKVYRYQRGKEPQMLSTVSVDKTEYTDKTATVGELYFYYLTTQNKAGKESRQSPEVGVRK